MFEQYTLVRQQDLHYIYGVNCYQSAIGYDTPVLCAYSLEENVVVSYLSLYPGSLDNKKISLISTAKESQDNDAYVDRLFKGCAEDGLIEEGQKFSQAEGFHTLALFFNYKEMDFHFARHSNGKWLSKFPTAPVISYKDIEALEKDTAYSFHSFFLAPINTTPGHIAFLSPRNIAARADNGAIIPLKQFSLDKQDLDILKINGFFLELDPKRKKAFYPEKTGKMTECNFPPWPLYPEGTTKADFGNGLSTVNRVLNRPVPSQPTPLSLTPLLAVLSALSH